MWISCLQVSQQQKYMYTMQLNLDSYLFFLHCGLESKSGVDWAQGLVVRGDVHWWEEIRLSLPRTDAVATHHLPCVNMARDGGHFLFQSSLTSYSSEFGFPGNTPNVEYFGEWPEMGKVSH